MRRRSCERESIRVDNDDDASSVASFGGRARAQSTAAPPPDQSVRIPPHTMAIMINPRCACRGVPPPGLVPHILARIYDRFFLVVVIVRVVGGATEDRAIDRDCAAAAAASNSICMRDGSMRPFSPPGSQVTLTGAGNAVTPPPPQQVPSSLGARRAVC